MTTTTTQEKTVVMVKCKACGMVQSPLIPTNLVDPGWLPGRTVWLKCKFPQCGPKTREFLVLAPSVAREQHAKQMEAEQAAPVRSAKTDSVELSTKVQLVQACLEWDDSTHMHGAGFNDGWSFDADDEEVDRLRAYSDLVNHLFATVIERTMK